MEQLSHNDIHALNNAISEIYAARDMESFYRSAFNTVLKIIPCELASFNEIVPTAGHTRILKGVHASDDHHHAFRKLFNVFNAHIHEHPFAPHFCSDNILKTGDLVSRSQFKTTTIYNEYYKHIDVETQIGVSIPVSQERVTLFALSRKDPDFSERDRVILTLLRPHLINGMRNVKERLGFMEEIAMLQKAADDYSRSVALLERDGKVKWISRRARYHLAEYLGASLTDIDRLPLELEEWVRRQILFPCPTGDRKPIRIKRVGRWLVVRLVHGDDGFMLLMKEEIPISLEAAGLTQKETEVLHWIAKGKTNKEISPILNISDRTVQKHLEHIYAKLRVETRTAAAVAVLLRE